MRYIPATILLALLPFTLLAVTISSTSLNTSNGLPDNNVRSIVSDSRGFLWLGTPEGAYRYDGYFFDTYRHTGNGAHNLLVSNHFNRILQVDSLHLLCCHPNRQYSLFDLGTDHFVEAADSLKQKLYQQVMTSPYSVVLPDSLQQVVNNQGNIIYDNLWNPVVVSNNGKVWHIDRKSHLAVMLQVFDPHLFALTQSHKYKVITLPERQITLVSTNGCGITLYDHRNKEIQHITASGGLIDTDYIIDMCADINDNIWVAEEFHGLRKLSFEDRKSEVILLDRDASELRANQVHVIQPMPDGSLLLANTLRYVYQWQASGQPQLYADNIDVHCACTDVVGGLWIGSRGNGLRCPDGRWLKHGDDAALSPSSDNIQHLLCDSQGRIWAGCNTGQLDLVIPQTDGSIAFRHFPLSDYEIIALMEDHRHRLWIGTSRGLYVVHPDNLLAGGRFDKVILGDDDYDHYIHCLYEDAQSGIWVGTNGNGLFHSTDDGRSFIHQTTQEGLIGNQIQTIVQDVYGIMWIATTDGMSCYNPKTGQYTYSLSQNDLLNDYYSRSCVQQLPDSSLVFGTNRGIVRYSPQADTDVRNPRQMLAITNMYINGVPMSQMNDGDAPFVGPVSSQHEVVLNHNQNSLTFHFSDFRFHTNRGTRYTCHLEGYEKGWSELSSVSSVQYRNLAPGSYRFHVRSVDYEGDGQLTLAIRILRPWWLRWWAWLIYISLATLIGIQLYRHFYGIYQLRQRLRLERRLTEFKLQFFTNIAHEFRTPLSIIRGSMENIIASGQIPQSLSQSIGSMQKGTARMLRLVNQLLEFRKMQNDKLTLALEPTEVVGFAREVFECFSDAAEVRELKYEFLPNVHRKVLNVDRQHLDKILYNLLSNALKYTPSGGEVKMLLRVDEQQLAISVVDTGVGIPPDKQDQLFSRFMQSSFSADSIGIGLHLSKALAERHHGTLTYADNPPHGSVFTLRIPATDDAYQPSDFLRPSELPSYSINESTTLEQHLMTPKPMNQQTVMLIEDDVDYCHYLQSLLQRYFSVQAFTLAVDALEVLSNDTALPDLIISDVQMPEMNGLEFTRRIRHNPKTRQLPVLLLTGQVGEEHQLEAVRAGADSFLTKPCSEQLLIMTCKQLLDQRKIMAQSQPAPSSSYDEENVPNAYAETIVDANDRRLLDNLNAWLDMNVSASNISVDDLAEKLGYRRSVFYQKVKALTGQTPADYVRTFRLNRAAELLRQGELSVSEVAFRVGFTDAHNFSRLFKKQFGSSPRSFK